MRSNFLLGALLITDDAKAKLRRIPFDLLAFHALNEHGRLTKRELRRNELAMPVGGKIMSRYLIDPTDPSQGYIVITTAKGGGETLIELENS